MPIEMEGENTEMLFGKFELQSRNPSVALDRTVVLDFTQDEPEGYEGHFEVQFFDGVAEIHYCRHEEGNFAIHHISSTSLSHALSMCYEMQATDIALFEANKEKADE